MSSHRVNSALYIEIEPQTEALADSGTIWSDTRVIVEALRGAATSEALFRVAATELRRATGFDRAMVYRFDAIGHGEVVGEDCDPDMEPILGLHYPASDVPRQARRLYLRQRVRVIADSAAAAVELVSAAGVAGGVDLSMTALRAASPIHLQYMRNMGVRASVAVSLTVDGALWGMLVCHHRGPRALPPGVRVLCDLIGTVTSLMIGKLRDSEARGVAARQKVRVEALAAQLAARPGAASLLAGVTALNTGLLELCEASGAVIRMGGQVATLGQAPAHEAAPALLDAIMAMAPEAGQPFATEKLPAMLPGQTEGTWAGALLLPLTRAPSDAILWLRREQAQTVSWGGDPSNKVEVDADTGALTPRRSFSAWQDVVRGRSMPWDAGCIEAANTFGQEIDRMLAQHAEAELARLRQHDPLTGLPNGQILRDQVDAWAQSRPCCCLLGVEIDDFEYVRELHGELAGDALLLQAGARIGRAALGALVARTGAAAFAVFRPDLSAESATQLAAYVSAALAEPFAARGQTVRVTASVGIVSAAYNARGPGADDLLLRAELAVTAARRRGGGSSVMFHDRLRGGARRQDIEMALRTALAPGGNADGALRLHYQPCVALNRDVGGAPQASGHIAPPVRGFEALLRWNHATLGSVAPPEIIEIAENSQLIDQLGTWILRQAILQISEWRGLAAGLPAASWRVTVNVSLHQLQSAGFAQALLALLAEQNIAPLSLGLEVTEAAFDSEVATDCLAALRGAGVHIAVDDFGLGTSSLAHLRHMPADELKLDRSFLHRADGAPLHENLLAALVQLAHAVGLSVLAEGVETDEQLAAVAAAGCDAAQGWLFAKPIEPEAAAGWIAGAAVPATPPRDHFRVPVSFRDVMQTINEMVMVTETDLDAPGPTIVYVNPAFARISGWSPGEVLGRSPRLLQGPGSNTDTLRGVGQALREGKSARARVLNYARSGMPIWVDMRISPLRDNNGLVTHFVGVGRDVTHEMRRMDELETLAERDPLTSVANRRGLERFAASVPQREGLPLCVAYIDLDRFKQINDTYGHPAGDALLLSIADVLSANMRRVDFVGRLGGDEFVVCMPSIQPSDALSVAERLQRTISETDFPTPAGPLRTNCSIGIAVMRPEDEGIDAVIARADMALYAAKQAGRGRVVLENEMLSLEARQ
jgi:diguanylate cyclase (GGDEF)-like protein/PAS domain S-box-containing protein